MFISIGKHWAITVQIYTKEKRAFQRPSTNFRSGRFSARTLYMQTSSTFGGELHQMGNYQWYYSSTIGGWLIYLKQHMEIKAKAVVEKKEYIR